jgi:hypothetical protein
MPVWCAPDAMSAAVPTVVPGLMAEIRLLGS